MTVEYLKKATKTSASDASDVTKIVQGILNDIEAGGEDACLKFRDQFDQYDGNVVLTAEEIQAACDQVPEKLKRDIQFAHANVKRFAEAQKSTIVDTEIEVIPGLIAGQKAIPCNAAGCYAPGRSICAHCVGTDDGDDSQSSWLSKHCGLLSTKSGALVFIQRLSTPLISVERIILSPLVVSRGLRPWPLDFLGCRRPTFLWARVTSSLLRRNAFYLVAWESICSRGPTDSLILADASADPELVAADLVGQAEHGYNSPVWLVTDHEPLARKVMELVPDYISTLPELNRDNATKAWDDYAEVVLCADREEMAATSDRYAPEHLTVQAEDLDWWLDRLTCYGSLFLGNETTVAFGDKASGPNHVLPTSGAAKYTGGLSVHKYMKLVTWQRSNKDAMKSVAEATARISRLEGMEAHARSADIRLQKFFPEETFDLTGTDNA